MTDENARRDDGPSRESEPEPTPAEEVAVDETSAPDAPVDATSDEETVEVVVDSTTEVTVPEGATVERLVVPETEVTKESTATAEELVAEVEEAVETSATPGDSEVDTEATAEAETEEPEPNTVAAAAAIETEEAEAIETTETAVAAEETETEAVVEAPAGEQRDDAFTWHPDHKGKTFDEVRSALAQDIASDQRQHRLAMDGAEESEQDALASVVTLERKWGPYDFDWAEQEPEALADRILEFERERERRRELISWSDYRNADGALDEGQVAGERSAELSTGAKSLSLLLVVLLIVVILLAVWAL